MTNRQLQDLIAKMSIDEKLAQITQLNPVCFGFHYITPLTGPDSGLRIGHDLATSIGSVLNCDNASDAVTIQKLIWKRTLTVFRCFLWRILFMGLKQFFPFP